MTQCWEGGKLLAFIMALCFFCLFVCWHGKFLGEGGLKRGKEKKAEYVTSEASAGSLIDRSNVRKVLIGVSDWRCVDESDEA